MCKRVQVCVLRASVRVVFEMNKQEDSGKGINHNSCWFKMFSLLKLLVELGPLKLMKCTFFGACTYQRTCILLLLLKYLLGSTCIHSSARIQHKLS